MDYTQAKDRAAEVYAWTGPDGTAYALGYLAGQENDKMSLAVITAPYQRPAQLGYTDGYEAALLDAETTAANAIQRRQALESC